MVEDLIIERAITTFIFESPHTQEVSSCGRLPLLGESGVVFSRVLLTNKAVAAGLQTSKGDIPYSLMNTFQYGLQISEEMQDIDNSITKIRCQNQKQYKSDLKKIFSDKTFPPELLRNYKVRVNAAIDSMGIRNSRFVVCGLIAQSFFEYAFNINNTKFLTEFSAIIDSRSVKTFYVWHPSPRSGKNGKSAWEEPENSQAINRLKTFINA